ncbi:MAG: hypothetical protein ACI8PD_000218 [Nitrospinales bacterium]|jgi:hypothetical protein
MTSVERNSADRLRLHPLHHGGCSGSHRNCNGVQLKRCLHHEQSQRFLLLPKATGPMVPAGDGFAFNNKKHQLPQVASVYVPHHDSHLSAIDCSDVSRVQQKGGWGTSVVDLRRIFVSTFGAGKVHSRFIYRQVPCKTSRQAKKFCLRLFTQSNCAGFLLHTHLVPARFWNSHDYLHGHLHNAFYRRAQEKVSVPFHSGNSSIYSISNSNRRVPNPENHFISQPMGRPYGKRVPSHPVFLCLWTRWVLGYGIGRRPSKTFSSSRSTYGFYFFSNWGRVGLCRNNGNRSPVLDLYLERIYDRLPSQRSFRNSFSNRTDSLNRFTGFYKPGSSFRSSSNKRIDLTIYKHGRVIDDGNDAFCRRTTEYFRANCKTLTMN